jgi:DtxR family Mn-dependent transcriptional regulator
MGSPKIEEYLEAIYKVASREGAAKPAKLAEYMGLTLPTVAEMLRKLEEKKLIKRRQKTDFILTNKGKKEALKLIRKHRLSERFLTDILGLSWDKVHAEACKLEHVLSPEVEESLDKLLREPKSCPHGHPIPDSNGVISAEKTCPLSELAPSQEATVISIQEENPEMLQYLATLGLLPEVKIKVEEVAPFGGPLLIKVGQAIYALGREVASKIMVKEDLT